MNGLGGKAVAFCLAGALALPVGVCHRLMAATSVPRSQSTGPCCHTSNTPAPAKSLMSCCWQNQADLARMPKLTQHVSMCLNTSQIVYLSSHTRSIVMFTKSATILVATLGLLWSAGDSSVAKPTCCAKRAYCCSIKSACCGKTATLERTVANPVAAAEPTAKPICCMKHAYCCSDHRACCPKGSKADRASDIGEAVAVSNRNVVSESSCCIKHAYCCSVSRPCCKNASAAITT